MEQKCKTETPEYDRIAREVFLPVFPVIAQKALQIYGRTEGQCLDIGCGGGMFGYFIALLSQMEIQFLDVQEDAIELCRRRGADWGLVGRCRYLASDVHHMALPDNSFPLIVSRGSIPFWGEGEALVSAFREIYRVLAPGGVTLIGGSLGPAPMREAIARRMKSINPEWNGGPISSPSCIGGYEEKSRLLREAGIPNRIECDDSGHWILLQK